MQEELVTSRTAKLAKNKGFDAPTFYYYTDHGTLMPNCPIAGYNKDNEEVIMDKTVIRLRDRNCGKSTGGPCNAPSQSLLQQWLRKQYNIHIEPLLLDTLTEIYAYRILTTGNAVRPLSKHFKSFEKALEHALYEALKLIKNG